MRGIISKKDWMHFRRRIEKPFGEFHLDWLDQNYSAWHAFAMITTWCEQNRIVTLRENEEKKERWWMYRKSKETKHLTDLRIIYKPCTIAYHHAESCSFSNQSKQFRLQPRCKMGTILAPPPWLAEYPTPPHLKLLSSIHSNRLTLGSTKTFSTPLWCDDRQIFARGS